MVPFDGVINHILFFDQLNGFDEVSDFPLYNMTYLVDKPLNYITKKGQSSKFKCVLSKLFTSFPEMRSPTKVLKEFVSVRSLVLLFPLYLSIKFVVEFGLCLALGFLFTIILIKFRITFFFNFSTLVWENNTQLGFSNF